MEVGRAARSWRAGLRTAGREACKQLGSSPGQARMRMGTACSPHRPRPHLPMQHPGPGRWSSLLTKCVSRGPPSVSNHQMTSPLSLCSRHTALAQLLKRAVPPRATWPGQVPVPPPGSPRPSLLLRVPAALGQEGRLGFSSSIFLHFLFCNENSGRSSFVCRYLQGFLTNSTVPTRL